MLVSCLGVVLVSAPAASAAGCDRVASPAGSDSEAGSETAPFRSAQKLVDSLAAGQTGCLRAGNYTENVKIARGGSASAPVVLSSWPGEQATVVGRLWVAKGANHVTVEHLYLDGRNASRLPSPTINAANTTFRHNDVTNQHTGICFSLGASSVGNDPIWGRATDTLIEDNRIHDCGRLPATNQDHGVYIEASDRVVIRDNWIYDNADRGVQLFPDAQNTTIANNVIDNNGEGVNIGGDGGLASSNNTIENNLITNSTIRANVETWWGDDSPVGSGNVVRGNCLASGKGGQVASERGLSATDNLVAHPDYSAAAQGDYRVPAGSPCSNRVDGQLVPGPAGSPARPHPVRHTRRIVGLRVRARGNRAMLVGKVLGVGRRGRVTILIRRDRAWRRVARARTRSGGRFVARTRIHRVSRRRHLRLRVVVRPIGRARTARVAVSR